MVIDMKGIKNKLPPVSVKARPLLAQLIEV